MDMWGWMPPLLASFVRAILTLRLLKPDMCEIFTVRTHTCHIANREQSCSSLVLLVLNGWVWSSPAVPSHEPREKKIASSMQMLHLTTAMMKKTQTGGYQSLVTMASTEIAQFFGAKIVTSSAKETLLQALPTSSQTCVASAASQRNHWRSLKIIGSKSVSICFHCHFSPSPYQIQDQDLCLDTSSSGTKTRELQTPRLTWSFGHTTASSHTPCVWYEATMYSNEMHFIHLYGLVLSAFIQNSSFDVWRSHPKDRKI